MARQWDAQRLLETMRGYQAACVLAAAVRLDLFTALGRETHSAGDLAGALHLDERGLRTLLDALAGLDLVAKAQDAYSLPPDLHALLARDGERSIHAGLDHQAVILPRWAELEDVVRTGVPYTHREDYQPPHGALESFIEAMHVFSSPEARQVVARVPLEGVGTLLDVGGGPGTWTLAFCQRSDELRAILFDRPEVLPIAERHVEQAGLAGRVELVGGSFYEDELPGPADLAFVSAIIHMNSRQQNRELFGRVFRALNDGGRIVIRDFVMDASHTQPPGGALFAVNMLVSTAGGGTFSFDEIREDLEWAGFTGVAPLGEPADMNSLVEARKA